MPGEGELLRKPRAVTCVHARWLSHVTLGQTVSNGHQSTARWLVAHTSRKLADPIVY